MGERARELAVLLLGDAFFFIAALWITLAVRYLAWPSASLLESHVVPFLLLTFAWVLIFFIAGLYDKHTTFIKTRLVSRIINTQVVNMLLAALMFLIIPFGIAPKTNLVLYL
jgi:FlaA1/EpsC-like NDP-sugar epimerase